MNLESRAPSAVITVLNLKGGVGKTHVCWVLASVCQERDRRCLIVDLDQQANFTQSFLPMHTDPSGVERIFDPASDADPLDLVHSTAYSHIDLIPVTGHFARFDLSRQDEWETTQAHHRLADVLTELAPAYDLVLLDCPPRISLASYAALCASDYVVIPLEAADWGARGTATVRALIDRVRAKDNPKLRLLGYIVSKFKRPRSFQLAYLEQIREAFGDDVFQTVIPDLAAFERSVDDAVPITLHSPSSHAARVARQLFDELDRRIEEHSRVGGRGRSSGASARASTLAGRN